MSAIAKSELKIFLCYSVGDSQTVRELYHRLKSDGFEPWLDEENLVPGVDWNREIQKAVRNSHIVVVCLSPESITKTGYVNKEISVALDVADLQPAGTIFIIPAKLRECDVPERLNSLHWVDLSSEKGYERLLKSLTERLANINLLHQKLLASSPQANPELALANANSSKLKILLAKPKQQRLSRKVITWLIPALILISLAAALIIGLLTNNPQLTAKLTDSRIMYGGATFSVAFSQNSKTLVSAGSGDGLVNLWETKPDGKLELLTNSNPTGTIKIKPFQTGTNDRASWAVYSRNGQRLAIASGSPTLKRWEVGVWEVDTNGLPLTEQARWQITTPSSKVASFGFSYDGKLLALPGSIDQVIIVEVETGQVTNSLPSAGLATELVFSRDITKLAISTDAGQVNLWDLTTPQPSTKEIYRGSSTPSLSFSPDEQLLGFSVGSQVMLYSFKSEKITTTLDTSFKSSIYSVVFHPNGKFLACAGIDGIIVIWDITTSKEINHISVGSVINNIAFSGDAKYLVTSDDFADKSVRLYSITF